MPPWVLRVLLYILPVIPLNMKRYLKFALLQHLIFSECLPSFTVGEAVAGSCSDMDFRVINNQKVVMPFQKESPHFYHRYEDSELNELGDMWNWPKGWTSSNASTFHVDLDSQADGVHLQELVPLDQTGMVLLLLFHESHVFSTESVGVTKDSLPATATAADANGARHAFVKSDEVLLRIYNRILGEDALFWDVSNETDTTTLPEGPHRRALSSYAALSERKICTHPSTPFLRILDLCGRRSLGDAVVTSQCLMDQLEKQLQERVTPSCAFCFGMSAACAGSHCRAQCLLNTCSTGCIKVRRLIKLVGSQCVFGTNCNQ